LAQAIIDYRTQNGPFQSLADLDNVPGLGPTKLEAIRDQLVFD
jgi:competence protein ComEA